MKKWLLNGLLFGLTLCGTSLFAQAHNYSKEGTTKVSGRFVLAPGKQMVITLNDWSYVENLYFSETYGQGGTAHAKAKINGESWTLVAPEIDPPYAFSVGHTTKTIRVYNEGPGNLVVGGMSVRIGKRISYTQPLDSVKQGVCWDNSEPCDGELKDLMQVLDPYFEDNLAIGLARGAEGIVSYLRDRTLPSEEYAEFLLPIKVAAYRVRIAAGPQGILDKDVIPALKALVKEIEGASDLTDKLLRKESTAKPTWLLLGLKSHIEDLLE